MPVIARVLHELGFKSVVGVLDQDKKEEAAQLRAAFPTFKFLLNPADDIRSKPARSTTARQGLLDEHWRLGQDRRKEAQELLTRINGALDGRGDEQD